MESKRKINIPEEYLKNLEKRVDGLKVILEISEIISSTLDLKDLMSLVMEKAKNQMAAEACSILLYNRESNKLEFDIAMCRDESTADTLVKTISLDVGQGIAGWVAEHRKPLIINDVSKDSRFYPDADRLTGFKTRSLIAVPLIGRSGLIGVAEIVNPKASYEPEIFESLCRQFAIAIENAMYHRKSIQQERLRQELEIAATLQRSFLPESPTLRKGGLQVSAVNIPAAKIGGDIYDFIELADDRIGVLIGDVSGKGISAALYMAKIISDFRYIAQKEDSPALVLSRLNSLLSRTPRGMFLTAIYLIADAATGNLQLSVAGHPPFLWFAESDVRVMALPAGPPLGIMETGYPITSIDLQRGDRLLLLTDGVFDAKNKSGNRIGFDNFVSFIKEHRDEQQVLQKTIDYVHDFSRGVERADDLTLVEIQWGI